MGIPMELRALWNHVTLEFLCKQYFLLISRRIAKGTVGSNRASLSRLGISLNLVASPSFLVLRHLQLAALRAKHERNPPQLGHLVLLHGCEIRVKVNKARPIKSIYVICGIKRWFRIERQLAIPDCLAVQIENLRTLNSIQPTNGIPTDVDTPTLISVNNSNHVRQME